MYCTKWLALVADRSPALSNDQYIGAQQLLLHVCLAHALHPDELLNHGQFRHFTHQCCNRIAVKGVILAVGDKELIGAVGKGA